MEPDIVEVLGPALAGALEKRGFTSLTSVQVTVLDPEHEGRDLRITSQTGSGKTVAIGFALRELAARQASRMGGVAHPYALVVAPTRELAKQVEEELSWLYEGLGTHVVSVTGGTSARDERRALASGPQIVVGTPGRMLDHLTRGAIDASDVGAVVLDEADRLLDLGFRDELDAILACTPEDRRTHLVSATFPREVRALADAVQGDPAHVEGTQLGQANVDIDHVLHLVDGRDRLNAMVNLLLANPEEQTLVFARTRADVGEIADSLSSAGFAAAPLSGEMEQNARDRAMQAFKRGDIRVLVATDVAARGIDVQDIARVLHADPPGDADTYTHRSGRTGRAGRKGVSSTLVPPSIMAKVVRLLHRAGVKYRFEKIPSANEIRKAQDDALIAELTRDDRIAAARAAEKAAADEAAADDAPLSGEEGPVSGEEGPASEEGAKVAKKTVTGPVAEHDEGPAGPPIDLHAMALAERLAKSGNVTNVIARLLMRARQATGPEPRWVRPIEPPSEVARPSRRSPTGAVGYGREYGRDARQAPPSRARRGCSDFEAPEGGPGDASSEGYTDGLRGGQDSQRPPPASQRGPRDLSRPWSLFQVTWGEAHGADSRRMLAMLCRRGGIESRDVGAIRVGRMASTVEIAADAADQFAQAAGQVDMRDPRIVIRPVAGGAPPPQEGRGQESRGSSRRRASRGAMDPRRLRASKGGVDPHLRGASRDATDRRLRGASIGAPTGRRASRGAVDPHLRGAKVAPRPRSLGSSVRPRRRASLRRAPRRRRAAHRRSAPRRRRASRPWSTTSASWSAARKRPLTRRSAAPGACSTTGIRKTQHPRPRPHMTRPRRARRRRTRRHLTRRRPTPTLRTRRDRAPRRRRAARTSRRRAGSRSRPPPLPAPPPAATPPRSAAASSRSNPALPDRRTPRDLQVEILPVRTVEEALAAAFGAAG